MKNLIKKSIVALFSFALLFTGQSAFAAPQWNGTSLDCVTVSVANFTSQTGYGNPCWPNTSVSANPGDSINVRIYYHNSSDLTGGNTTYTGVRLVLNAPTGASTNQSFSGQIVSNQGTFPFNPINVTIPTAQTLTFGSARWYPNQSATQVPFLNGQTGAELLNGAGLDIGTIAPGWSTQGSVVLSFLVGSTASNPCTINSFTASPTVVTAGQPVTLSWTTSSSCSGVTITNLASFTGTSGSTVVYPTANTNYTLQAINSSGVISSTQSVGVNVNATANCTISNFNASSTSITSGQPVTLGWNTSNCTGVNISGVGAFGTSGNTIVYPTATTTYTLTATGSSGSTTQSVLVTVNGTTGNCTITSFSANPNSITAGNPATITWNTSNCTSATVSGSGMNNNSLSGSQVVYPSTSGTYVITAYGTNGSVTQSAYVTVNGSVNNCVISNFTANGSTSIAITSGTPVTVYWNTTNCSTVTVSGPNLTSSNLNGSQLMYPTYSGTYTLTAYGSNGFSQNQTIYVSVGASTSNCSIGSLTASNTNVSSGTPVTIYWTTSNCSSATMSGPGINSNALSGSQVVYPSTTGTYTLTAYGSNGTAPSQALTVTVNGFVNSNVVTTVATNVTNTSARLNGLISNGSAGITTTYFEFGPTVNLGYQTAAMSTSGTTFSDTISNLSPNTIYYFRAVGGASKGTIEIFETTGGTTTTVSQGTTVTTNSPIKLKIEDRYETIGVGDVVDYTITYKNIGKSKLTKPMIQVVAPKNIILTNASAGTYSADTNTLSIPLEDLASGQEGTIYAQGKVNSISSNTAQIVTTAILVYTNANGAQENAMAYVLNKPKDLTTGSNSTQGAAALFAGVSSLGLIGWLILALVILMIVHFARGLARPVAKPAVTRTTNIIK